MPPVVEIFWGVSLYGELAVAVISPNIVVLPKTSNSRAVIFSASILPPFISIPSESAFINLLGDVNTNKPESVNSVLGVCTFIWNAS